MVETLRERRLGNQSKSEGALCQPAPPSSVAETGLSFSAYNVDLIPDNLLLPPCLIQGSQRITVVLFGIQLFLNCVTVYTSSYSPQEAEAEISVPGI